MVFRKKYLIPKVARSTIQNLWLEDKNALKVPVYVGRPIPIEKTIATP